MQENFLKTQIAHDNWASKYQYGTETTLGTFQRGARELAKNEKDPEKWYPIFLETLLRFDNGQPTGLKCTPGGRITSNIGTDYNGATLINCFIAGPVKNATLTYVRQNENFSNKIELKSSSTADDLVNIFLTILEQAKTLASEGGWGLNFDFIRPRGSLIKGTGIRHPGVVSYMEVFDSVAECIVKGDNDGYVDTLKSYLTKEEQEAYFGIVKKMTRKGAMMGALSVNHPDIEEFVRAKRESGKLTKFNMSVAVTDDFMEAVINDKMWDLVWDGIVVKRVKAQDLYNLIMTSTYNRSEPGIIFVDNMDKNNPISYLGKCNATNPCIRKGSFVTTNDGLFPVEDFSSRGRKIQTTLGFGEVENVEIHENEDIYRVKFSDGFYQDVTMGHIFHTMNDSGGNRKSWNNEKRLSDIKVGDYVRKQWYKSFPNISDDLGRKEGLLVGLYLGDGCFSNSCGFNIACNATEDNSYIEKLYSYFGGECRIDQSSGNGVRYYMTGKNAWLSYLFDRVGVTDKNIQLLKLINTNKQFILGLIDGLLSSDGNVNTKARYPQVRFKNTSMEMHTLLKHLFLFVKADYKLYKDECAGESHLIEGREVVRRSDMYVGIIDNDSILNMYDSIGYLSHPKKNEELKKIITMKQLNGVKWKTKITSIEYIGKDTVYDLYEPNADDWNHEGYVSRGCGEIPGNPDMTTVCLLGSVNLTQYVNITESKEVVFDWDLYTKDIHTFTRMLDNVCDLSILPLPSYKWAVENLRQFGMGLNGLGSTLLMLNIPYNSKEGIEFTKKINQIKENITMQASSMLAKEKGAFPLYDYDKYSQTEYFKSDRLWDETKQMIKENGLRNAKTTTNPPLGNTSVVCDNVSNGIEPIFAMESERKVICAWPEGLNSDNVKIILSEKKKKDFVFWEGEYNGKSYYYEPHNRGLCEIYILRDYGYQWMLDNFPENKNSKAVVCTNDINLDDHLAIQEVIQYYCNQSVSKTINLPNKFSFDEFKELYINAWKKGLIGVTTYRTGSMESVIESLERAEEKKEIIPKGVTLPTEFVNGNTRTIKKEGMKFYIHFSYLPEDKDLKYPIAMWIHTNQSGNIRASNKACKSLGKLAIECGIATKIVEDTWDKCLGDYAHNRLGRMISLCLRHNIPREDILVSLAGIEGDNVSTLLTAVRKFIAETIEDGKEIVGMKCPSCGSDRLIMQSGCFTCSECDYAGCGA